EMIQFVDKHRDRFSIEVMCKTLNTQRVGGVITSRAFDSRSPREVVKPPTPTTLNVLHMNSTEKRPRWLSMNWIISDVVGRVPMRKSRCSLEQFVGVSQLLIFTAQLGNFSD